ncbi:MAG: cytochrome c biogenesis protein CcmG/thiol:disulfide interchange protein DsbE [Alteromonadaceae bacterium]|jgi:cytochrome c biogenesis protein CcmG/thiol:disulfide interchange protein DsbE
MKQIVSWLSVVLLSIFLLVSTEAIAAPNFSLKTEEGKTVSLADYKGQPLVLHFWATWCPYCKKLQPGLNALYEKYQPQGLKMLAVSIWEDEGATPQAVLNKRGYGFKTVINGDDITKMFNVKGTPTTVFINRAGEVVWRTDKSDPKNPKLEKAILDILKKA